MRRIGRVSRSGLNHSCFLHIWHSPLLEVSEIKALAILVVLALRLFRGVPSLSNHFQALCQRWYPPLLQNLMVPLDLAHAYHALFLATAIDRL